MATTSPVGIDTKPAETETGWTRRERSGGSGRKRLTLSLLLATLAIGLASNSMLGPLVSNRIEYHYTDSLINQAIGLDAVALFLAAPVALIAARLVALRHRAGPPLAFIPSTFAAYMAPQYIIGPDYLGLPGNNERFFLLHLGLLVVAIAAIVVAWDLSARSPSVATDPRSDRRQSWMMIGLVAFIFGGMWLGRLIELTGGAPQSAEYQENPTAYLLVGLLDLGVVVPAALACAFGLRKHILRARIAAWSLIGWFTLVPAAVAAMAVVMLVKDDPSASTASTLTFVAAAAVFSIGAGWLYRPLFVTSSD